MSDDPRLIRLIMELRREGINDARVLGALERIPRDVFIPEAFRDQAYDNIALPIALGQTISQPYVVAFMTQALEVGPRMKVLEIGTGSGYQAAILAKLCRRVYSIERHPDLSRQADKLLSRLRIHNVTTKIGDGYLGWPEVAPFERIIVTAAPPEIPRALTDQLADGGILLAPVGGNGFSQSIVRLRRNGDKFERDSLLPVRFVPLVSGVASEDSDKNR